MGEEKEVGIKPEDLGEGGKGVEEQEVGGRGLVVYTCGNCGARNWTPACWHLFSCWNCGTVIYP